MTVLNLDFPQVHGGQLSTALFKSTPEDFIVKERLPDALLPSESTYGEHLYVHATKTNMNTHWLAKQLAKIAGVSERDVGYCGLKDRHAVTSQWLSFYLPKKNKDFRLALPETLASEVILHQQHWASKKLRRGMHAANQFQIRLRDFDIEPEQLDARMAQISKSGVPNYFGAQRFGRDGNNLVMADQLWVKKQSISVRSQKNMAVSAARSYLFNLVLAQRVRQETWSQRIEGDIVDEQGHPTGPLWGRGRVLTQDLSADLEHQILNDLGEWLEGLEHCGLKQERRALVLSVHGLDYHYADRQLMLSFELAPGQYATSVLAEFVNVQQPL